MGIGKKDLEKAILDESNQFKEYYLWLEKHMPPRFFNEITREQTMLLAHNLMGFHMQSYFSQIFMENSAFVLCLDSQDADLRILKHYNLYGIRNYQTYLSDTPPPFPGVNNKLRIAAIYFSEVEDVIPQCDLTLDHINKEQVYEMIQERDPEMTYDAFHDLICHMNPRFLRSLNEERLAKALSMFFRAKTRDYCQYEVSYNEHWETDGENNPSMRIVFAWRNTPKHRFLLRLAKTIFRHNLVMTRVNATYIEPYSTKSILIMAVGLNGADGKAAWEAADIDDFLKELVNLKYFDYLDTIESVFVDSGMITGNQGNLLRTFISFVHQVLVHADPNLYSVSNIEEALCRHPELSLKLLKAFELKFHPDRLNYRAYKELRKELMSLVDEIDTGNVLNDTRRMNVLKQSIYFIEYTLKTNYYRNNKSAISFRLNPTYLDHAPFDRSEKFPELPFAIFFVKGMHFIGFHIRFKDLSRGGLRTVMPQRHEQMVAELNNVFLECYNLAYTQQKKNKDIPEGGSKAIIFLEPYERLHSEADIYRTELQSNNHTPEEIEEKLSTFRKEQKIEYLYQTQRAFIHSFVTIVNCEEDGSLKARDIVDYWKKPEYIYLGPDENMHNVLIEWISEYSKTCGYKPGVAFISSKPGAGINHKEYGITSFGVNVYMIETLKFLGINPEKDPFTIKISGGPDGDVAGNQILNLYKYFPKTAKLLALTDISGTIYDPEGLHLDEMAKLFKTGQSINRYPVKKLNDGGFLLDTQTKREQSAYVSQTLCYHKDKGKVIEKWLSGNDMNHILRTNLHQTPTDIFIPAGGRPRTLNEQNYYEYLDETGTPTSKAIVEGANLYLTPGARTALEELGVIIVKDSSANKGGVICSSLEVLAGLTLTEEEFLLEKNAIMEEILAFISEKAKDEADLLLRSREQLSLPLTVISDKISLRINTYTYEILDYLETITLSSEPDDPLIQCLFNYCPPLFVEKYQDRLLQMPDMHKKAMIACYIASKLVYKRGLKWSPSIVDILPLIAADPSISRVKLKSKDIKNVT